jgi:hypothetical protein
MRARWSLSEDTKKIPCLCYQVATMFVSLSLFACAGRERRTAGNADLSADSEIHGGLVEARLYAKKPSQIFMTASFEI